MEEKKKDIVEDLFEGAEYSSKSEFNKPKLVEEAVRNCIEARSKEMKSGYNNYKLDKEGNPIAKVWIPDTRKVFDSHVTALRNLLSPEIEKDSTFKEKDKEIVEKKKELFERYCYKKREFTNKDNKPGWTLTGEKEIPEKDARTIHQDVIKNTAEMVEGTWNSKVFTYWNLITNINDELFSELNKLVDRLNYFKSKVNY